MKTRRGFTLIHLVIVLGAVAAVLAALWGAIKAWDSYTAGLIAQGDKAGYTRAMQEVAIRDNRQLEAVTAALTAETKRTRDREAAHRDEMRTAADNLRKEQQNAKLAERRVLDGLRDGTIKLRGFGADGNLGCGPTLGDKTAAGPGGTASGGGDGAGEGGFPATLPRPLSDQDYFIEEFGRADKTARALKLAQDTIRSYLAVCNTE